MLPQYAQRQPGGEIAIWLLITIGALLIPIIAIAICCIRRHLQRRPHITLMENRSLRVKMNTKRAEALRSYNGPYMESSNDDGGSMSRTNSLKKQHVHWPDGTSPNTVGSYCVKKYPLSDGNILTATTLTESPSSHRRAAPSSSAFTHLIQAAIIPAGSTVTSTDPSQLLTLSKEFASMSAEHP